MVGGHGGDRLVHGFAALLIMRVILGLGESVAFPSYSKILANGYFKEHRGFANSMIIAGLSLGPALGIMVGGARWALWMASVFLVLGLAGIALALPWAC